MSTSGCEQYVGPVCCSIPNTGIHPFKYFFSVRGNPSSLLRLRPNRDTIDTTLLTTLEAKHRCRPKHGHYKCHDTSSFRDARNHHYIWVGILLPPNPTSADLIKRFTMRTQLPILSQRIFIRQNLYNEGIIAWTGIFFFFGHTLPTTTGFPHRALKQRSQSCKHETSICEVGTYRWDDGVSQLQAIPESRNIQEETPNNIFILYFLELRMAESQCKSEICRGSNTLLYTRPAYSALQGSCCFLPFLPYLRAHWSLVFQCLYRPLPTARDGTWDVRWLRRSALCLLHSTSILIFITLDAKAVTKLHALGVFSIIGTSVPGSSFSYIPISPSDRCNSSRWHCQASHSKRVCCDPSFRPWVQWEYAGPAFIRMRCRYFLK